MRTTPSGVATNIFSSRPLQPGRGEEHMGQLKLLGSLLWDELDAIQQFATPKDNAESARLVALAKTYVEITVMFGVKALSRNHEGAGTVPLSSA